LFSLSFSAPQAYANLCKTVYYGPDKSNDNRAEDEVQIALADIATPRHIRIYTAKPSDIRSELPSEFETKKVLAYRQDPGLEVVVVRNKINPEVMPHVAEHVILSRSSSAMDFEVRAIVKTTEGFRPSRLLTLRTNESSYIVYGDRFISIDNEGSKERYQAELDWSSFTENGKEPYPVTVAASKELFDSPLGPMLAYVDVGLASDAQRPPVLQLFNLRTKARLKVPFPIGKHLSLPKVVAGGTEIFVLEDGRGQGLAFHRFKIKYNLGDRSVTLVNDATFDFQNMYRDQIRDYAVAESGEYLLVFNNSRMQALELDEFGYWNKPYFIGTHFAFGNSVYYGHFTADSHIVFNNGYSFKVEAD
jgi:hypothetical protein